MVRTGSVSRWINSLDRIRVDSLTTKQPQLLLSRSPRKRRRRRSRILLQRLVCRNVELLLATARRLDIYQRGSRNPRPPDPLAF